MQAAPQPRTRQHEVSCRSSANLNNLTECDSPRPFRLAGRFFVVRGGNQLGEPKCRVHCSLVCARCESVRRALSYTTLLTDALAPRTDEGTMNPTLRLALLMTISIASFATWSKAAPQNTSSSPSVPATSGAGKQPNSELESAVSQFSRREEDLPKGPPPRMADGHPDLSGYWVASTK